MDIKKEIGICCQVDDSCVKTAVELVRKALGYRTPSILKAGSITTSDLTSEFGNLFPRHKIIAFTTKETEKLISQKNVVWGGDMTVSDNSPCIWLFAYSSKFVNKAHMVIGFPTIYGDMELNVAYRILL